MRWRSGDNRRFYNEKEIIFSCSAGIRGIADFFIHVLFVVVFNQPEYYSAKNSTPFIETVRAPCKRRF
jgi:hypothetical protein